VFLDDYYFAAHAAFSIFNKCRTKQPLSKSGCLVEPVSCTMFHIFEMWVNPTFANMKDETFDKRYPRSPAFFELQFRGKPLFAG